jgi:hypothetical protein
VARINEGPGTVRAIAIIPERKGNERKDEQVDSGCKPMNGAGIYLDGAGRADCSPLMNLGGKALYMGWLGARGFRDFSRLPPVQENRGQPEDPASRFFG